MLVKIKSGETIKVQWVSDTTGIVTGTNVENGKPFMVDKEEILDIINDTLTLWDILRGIFSKLRILFKK
ncbi:MAG: hypothetical protein U5L45_15830 [Saprospiraceae bacterium]|nr:hypothetical protein [Saprospiraceae bacterium]